MAKITWIGTDPSCNWGGIEFYKGKVVEITNPHMIGKARDNRFFKVVEDKAKEPPKEVPREEAKPATDLAPEKEKEKAKVYDFREAEKGSGYSPVKKKVKKPKVKSADKHADG